MKKRIWALFSLLFVGVECVYAERMKSYTENFDSTIVTAKTTELGLGNYLEGGAALLLGGSDSFSRAWPDLGYDWSAVLDGGVCNGIEVNERRAKVDVGRVRVVLPKGDGQGQAVGFELIPMRSGQSGQEEGHEESVEDENPGLEFGELCALIGDETLKAMIEASMAFVSSYLAPGVPASGTWNSTGEEASALGDVLESSYQMVWSGRILDAEAAKKMSTWGGKTPTWSLGGDKSVVWLPHSWEMMSEGASESESSTAEKGVISFDVTKALTLGGTRNAEFFLIGKKSEPESGYWVTPSNLTVEEGQIGDADVLELLRDVKLLEIWTKARPKLWEGISDVPKIWLVTEKAIPVLSVKPSVYFKGYDYW